MFVCINAWVCLCACGHGSVHLCSRVCMRICVCMCLCAYVLWIYVCVYCGHGVQVLRHGNHMLYTEINLSFHLPFNNCHSTRVGICFISYYPMHSCQDSWSSSLFLLIAHDAIKSKAVIPLKMNPLSSSLLLLL